MKLNFYVIFLKTQEKNPAFYFLNDIKKIKTTYKYLKKNAF